MRTWPLPSSAAVALLLPLSGCCSLARFFCGPDRTPWISVDYSTPDLAVKTLLEALRRADPQILYRSLSDRYRAQLGITDLTTDVGYGLFQDANPGLHVAGYAAVPPPRMVSDDQAEFTLVVEGTPVEVTAVRRRQWRVSYRRVNGNRFDPGHSVHSFTDVARVDPEAGEDRSRLTIGPLTVKHTNLDELPLHRVEFAGIEAVWRIDAIRVREAP